jgi:hypothetical protein
MSRVRDKADFQFAGEDYSHSGGVKYVANMIQTTDLTASGTITDVHLQDIQDVNAVTASDDGRVLAYDHATTSFKWVTSSAGSTLTIQDEGSTLTTDATTLNFVGTGVTASGTGATKTITISSGGGGSMNDLIDDASPQLGGDLDVNGNSVAYTFSLTGSSSPNYRFSDSGSNFFNSTTSNPTLYLTRGTQYNFANIAVSHPFRIQSVNSAGGTLYNTGVTNNNGTGTVTFTPTMDAPDELYYYCNAHSSMKGIIKIIGNAATGDISFSGSIISSSGASVVINDNLTLTGNLTVNGTTTTINTATLNISDNIVVLNNDVTGTPNQNAGLEIERGTSSNVDIRWNEASDKWEFTNDGTTYNEIGSGGNVVDDTTPQLGGDLDLNSNDISGTGNISITGSITSSQAGAPVLTSASSITLEAATSSRVHVSQSPLRLYNVSTTNRNAITMADGDLVYDSDLNKAFVAENGSWVSLFTAGGAGAGTSSQFVGSVIEETDTTNTNSGTITFYANNYQILRLNVDQLNNRTLFIGGDSSTTLNNSLSTGQAKTVAVSFQNGSTPYYINLVQIDGTTVTPQWSGGSAPSAGNANSTDWYTFSIIKTGSAAFEVFGTFTQFA